MIDDQAEQQQDDGSDQQPGVAHGQEQARVVRPL
jgi:hypothetical protein